MYKTCFHYNEFNLYHVIDYHSIRFIELILLLLFGGTYNNLGNYLSLCLADVIINDS